MQSDLSEGQLVVDPYTGEQAFAVSPITNCQHALGLDYQSLTEYIKQESQQLFYSSCSSCNNVGENWICLQCQKIYCSRYVKGHMAEHNQINPDHQVALSFADLSFWCYSCDSYITNQQLSSLRKLFQKAKFNEGQSQSKNENNISQDKYNEIKQKVANSQGFFVVGDINIDNAFQTLIIKQFPQDIVIEKGVLKGYTTHNYIQSKAQSLKQSKTEEVIGSVIRFNKATSNLIRDKITFLMNEIEGFPSQTDIKFEKVNVGDEQVELTIYCIEN